MDRHPKQNGPFAGIRRLSSSLLADPAQKNGRFVASTGRSATDQQAGISDPRQTAGINSTAVSSCPDAAIGQTTAGSALLGDFPWWRKLASARNAVPNLPFPTDGGIRR
jgi:hypothetical protein